MSALCPFYPRLPPHLHNDKIILKYKGQRPALPSPSCLSCYLKICLLSRPPFPGLILSSSGPRGSRGAPMWGRSLELDLWSGLHSAPPPTCDPTPFSGQATGLHLTRAVTVRPGKHAGVSELPAGPWQRFSLSPTWSESPEGPSLPVTSGKPTPVDS